MGTRADFYVGRGTDAEWLGSVAWDGNPSGFDTPFYVADSESQYRGAVAAISRERDDWIAPDRGWPWPWDTSSTSDYAYAFDGGKVYATNDDAWWVIDADAPYMGDPISAIEDEHEYNSDEYREAEATVRATMQATTFPNMNDRAMSLPEMLDASGMIVVTTTTTTPAAEREGVSAK